MYNYNCPDCNDTKLQSDKNTRKINEVIEQVNELIKVNNETVDFIEEKAKIKVNEVVGELKFINSLGVKAINNRVKTISELLGTQGLGYDDIEKEFPFIAWERICAYWSFIEQPNGDYIFNAPHFDLDSIVATCEKHRRKIILFFEIGNAPEWLIEKYPSIKDKFQGASNYEKNAWFKFVKAVVERYKGKGIVWEFYNEPNIYMDIINWVKTFSETVRGIDSSGIVIAPSYDSCNSQNLTIHENSLANLIDKGIMNLVDGISMHNYKGNIPEAESTSDNLLGLVNTLNSKGYAGYPIYITEWSYSLTNNFEVNTVLTENEQADYLSRLYLHNSKYGTMCNIWHVARNSADENTTTIGSHAHQEANFGLLRNDMTKKPCYYAMELLNKALGNAHFVKSHITPVTGLRVFEYNSGSQKILAYYTTSIEEQGFIIRTPNGQVLANMDLNYQNGEVTSAQPTPVDGLYIFYASTKVRYIVLDTASTEFQFIVNIIPSTHFTGNIQAIIQDGYVKLNGTAIYNPSGVEEVIPSGAVIADLRTAIEPRTVSNFICLSVDVPNNSTKFIRVGMFKDGVIKVYSDTAQNGSRIDMDNISYYI